jgi:hypothetical protein
MPSSWTVLVISFRVSSKGALLPGSPRRVPVERYVPFPGPSFICLSNSLLTQAPFRVPRWDHYEESCPLLGLSLNYLSESPINKVSWRSKISPSFLKSLVKQLLFPGPPAGHIWRERRSVSRASDLFFHLYLPESSVKELSTNQGENIWSPSTEPHGDGKPTQNWVRPGSLKGPFTILLLLSQCHAAFSTIRSTLTWVDQIPISQRVSQ